MKYKRLPLNELQLLEKEFIKFLAVNSITADDWIKIQEESSEKMDELIEEFSDLVYHRVMQKVSCLDHRTKNEVKVFKTEKEKISLIAMSTTATDVNFLDENDFNAILSGNKAIPVEVYKSEKAYQKEREVEIFDLLENGCCIVDPSLYDFFEKIHQNA